MDANLIRTFTETLLDLQRNVEALRGETLFLAQSLKDSEGRNQKHFDTISTQVSAIVADLNRQNTRSEIQDAQHSEQIKSMQSQLTSALVSLGRQHDLQNQAIAEFTMRLESIQAQCDRNSETLLLFRHPMSFITTLNWQDRFIIGLIFFASMALAIIFLLKGG